MIEEALEKRKGAKNPRKRSIQTEEAMILMLEPVAGDDVPNDGQVGVV